MKLLHELALTCGSVTPLDVPFRSSLDRAVSVKLDEIFHNIFMHNTTQNGHSRDGGG